MGYFVFHASLRGRACEGGDGSMAPINRSYALGEVSDEGAGLGKENLSGWAVERFVEGLRPHT